MDERALAGIDTQFFFFFFCSDLLLLLLLLLVRLFIHSLKVHIISSYHIPNTRTFYPVAGQAHGYSL